MPPAETLSTRTVNLFACGYDVYVGSPVGETDPRDVAPGEWGFLGNPFEHMLDEDARIEAYRRYFLKRVKTDQRFRDAVLACRGKRLGCFCEQGKPEQGKPERCHAEVIASYLDSQHLRATRSLSAA